MHIDYYDENERIATTLFISPNDLTSKKMSNYYALHNNQSPKLKQNQLSLYGIEIIKQNDRTITIPALIRSTITKPVQLQSAPIVLLDKNGKVRAREIVNFSKLETLRPNTAQPWIFHFSTESTITNITCDKNSWLLAFEQKSKHRLDIRDLNRANVSAESIDTFNKIVDQAPPLDQNELSFLGLTMKREAGGLKTTLLLRNGTSSDLELKQAPLIVYDATGDRVAKGTFTFSKLIIKANTSKPLTLIFPKSSIIKDRIDLTSWSVKHAE
ncbi:SLAP domain-containing protein [Virgibacillus sp. W0430]|uniref:SLAP domain-containing protein n=1 Tax=Virgibacillus sp. W0430 TaxID=3391580 RepID=UPI003F48BC09